MGYLNSIDYTIIVVYFTILIGLGIYLQKKASASLEDYFLGGRSIPWWALGISGMAAWLDVTGTMVITSFLFLLGPRGLFIEFRGGAVLLAVICLLWTGKWHRRSQCLTAAEWMVFRFGEGFFGQFARVIFVLAGIIGTIGSLGYMIKGIGLFLSMFLPFSPIACALILILVATVYTMISGFYGVVFTDIFQSGIVIVAVICVSILAISKVTGQEALADLAAQVTGNSQWVTSSPQWQTEMPTGYECYHHLMMFTIFYLLRSVFGGTGAGAEPKYLAARNDRECGTLTFMTIFCIMFRWPMMLAFAILGLFLVRDIFPDQSVMVQSIDLIKSYFPATTQADWATLLSHIINHPSQYSPDLINGLREVLGQDWASKIYLVSFEGTVNPERILPSVILMSIPMGLRGMILVALIAASMSTFDSMVNGTTALFVCDIYRRYIRPKAHNKELIATSWIFIMVLVSIGFLFAHSIRNINDIWGWIAMSLSGGLMIPTILRLYWWRFNGGGFAIGTIAGMTGAIIQRMFFPEMDERIQFTVMAGIGLVGSILGTFLTKPTDKKVLEHFYRITRPFGLWKDMIKMFSTEHQLQIKKEHRNDILAIPFVLGWQISLFLLPMQLLVRSFAAFTITLFIFMVSLIGMYFFWYRNLPVENYEFNEI